MRIHVKDERVLLKGRGFEVVIRDGETVKVKGPRSGEVLEKLKSCYFFDYCKTPADEELTPVKEHPLRVLEELAHELKEKKEVRKLCRFLEELLERGSALLVTFEMRRINIFGSRSLIWKEGIYAEVR